MGLCPSLARSGDLIVFAHGVDLPMVLREVSPGIYRFLGQCYIHGIIHGEAMSFHEARAVQDCTLT